MEKQYYIYITTNLINGKQYIGKHYGLINDDYFGSGILLQKALKKYGKENFKKQILEFCSSEEEANVKEKQYINLFNATENKNFYNIADGGQGGYVTKGYSKEQRLEVNKKISNSVKGKNHPMYGKQTSEETKQKIKDSLKKYWTEEKRQERSQKYRGDGNPMFGKHHSAESILKRIEHTDFSVYRTQQYRQKMSKATSGSKNGNFGNKGDKAKNGKKILMYDKNHLLIQTFNTKRMVLQFLGIKGHTGLDRAIKQKTLYKNYYWQQI